MTDTAAPALPDSRTASRPDPGADSRSGLRRIAAISASLVGTYALTSVLGLGFWLLAARQFSVSAVGVAGAAVALMTLLSTLGTVGLGTLLIARLPVTAQGERRVLARTALTVAGVGGTVLAVVVPFVAIEVLRLGNVGAIAGTPGDAAMFAIGTGLMSVALVVDQAVLVVGTGSLQLERNALASATKLVALLALAAAGATGGMTVFAAWTIGTLVSLPLVAWRTRGGRALEGGGRLLELRRVRALVRPALSHHALNTTLQATLQVLPLIVLVAVSKAENGVFSTTLQLVGVVFTLPFAISIGLFAASAGDARGVLERMRFTIPVSFGISLLANLLLFPLAPFALSLFGSQYAADGVDLVRILALAGLPFVVKDHYVALRRVQDRTGQATRVLVAMTVVELVAAVLGARYHGAVGLAGAWVAVLFVEAVVLAVPLLTATRAGIREAGPTTPTEGAVAPVRSEVTLSAASEGEPTPEGRRARILGRLGPGPALLVMTCGLLLMAFAVSTARTSGDGGTAEALWVVGLVVVFLPAALAALLPGLSAGTRVVLVMAMAMLLQVSRVVLYPTRFMFHDELIHANLLRILGETGRLFSANPLLPITSYYPGLEVATDAVQSLLGLSAHTSAVVVLLAARLVLSGALLLGVAKITGSTRIGALAVVVYACNPQMLFFNSQYSYQSLALPLAMLTVYLFLRRRRGGRLSVLPTCAAFVAVAFTHHVTTGLLLAAFVVWWLLELGLRRGRSRQALSLGVVVAVGGIAFAVTLLNPGNTLGTYLSSIGESAVQAVEGVVTGRQQHKVFQNSAGVATRPWEQVAIIASILLTLAVLVPALFRARRLVRLRVSVVALLLLVACLYPLIPAGHLTTSTAEVGDRSAGFVFIGVAFVVAWWLCQHRIRAWQGVALGLAASVAFVGSVVLGAGSVSQQLPGPFRVSDDARSVDPDNLAAAEWMHAHLPAGSVVYADRVGSLLAGAVGGMHPITHIGSSIDASRLLLDPTYGPQDVALIRRAHIRYLVADRRDAFGLPNQDVYIETGEFGGPNRTRPVPAAALDKFSRVPGVDVVYDNGSVTIYDLEALDGSH